MISIAICDDDEESLHIVKKIVDECFHNMGQPYNKCIFKDSKSLYYEIEEGNVFDLLILDIEMPHIDGIELTNRVKEFLPNALIVFVTNYEKYVYESFKVQPFRFVPKKNCQTMLRDSVIDAYSVYKKNVNQYIVIENHAGIEKVQISQVQYIWHSGKYAIIEMENGNQTKTRKTLKQVFEILPKNDFVWIDRGCICNLMKIAKIQNGDIYLNDGTRLQVSRDRLVEIKQILRKYWLD